MDDLQVSQFREKVRELKEEYWQQLLDYYKDSPEQNPIIINSYVKQLEELYELLAPVLLGKVTLADLSSQNFISIFSTILPEDTPHYILSACLYYARRDLIMFPLTRDTQRIDSLPDKNSLENVNFLSNE